MQDEDVTPDQPKGYFESPWPGEDGGPQRLQIPRGTHGLDIQSGERLVGRSRRLLSGNMVVLREPGEVYIMTVAMFRNRLLRLPAFARIEKIDPVTLQTIVKSPKLKGGGFWPGGFAVHRNGDLYLTYGSHCHRLNADCELIRSYRLPKSNAYNSLVILDNGYLAMKQISDTDNAVLSILDPNSLEPVCDPIEAPEPSISRLSAKGNTVYLTGTRSIFRYNWNDERAEAEMDEGWVFEYLEGSKNSYGWDPVIGGNAAWFMDNGKHNYHVSMLNAGLTPTPLNAIRVSLADTGNNTIIPVSGIAGGSVTNPPLYCPKRKILVAYDSANGVICGFQHDAATGSLSKIWKKMSFFCGGHMIYYQDTGEVVTNDYRRFSDSAVVLDIESGYEKGRTGLSSLSQGVVFSSPGWARDFYYLTFSSISRIEVR